MKKIRIICLVLESVATTALFLPWCYSEKYFSHGTNTHTYNQNFFGGLSQGGGVISYIVLLLMIASIILIVRGIISSKDVSLLEVLFPFFALIFMAISVFIRTEVLVDDGIFAFWRFDFNWLMYIIIAIQIAIATTMTISKFVIQKQEKSH